MLVRGSAAQSVCREREAAHVARSRETGQKRRAEGEGGLSQVQAGGAALWM